MATPPPLASSLLGSLQARITDRPWHTLGSAFLLGAWLGHDPPRAPSNALLRTMFAMVGSLALRVLRELVIRELVAGAARPMHESGV